MKKLSILVHEDVYWSSATSALDLFSGANRYLERIGESPAFDLELVGERPESIQLGGTARFIRQVTIQKVTQTDLIVIPGFDGASKNILGKYGAIIEWIKSMRRSGTEIASLCVGSFFLAEAGLLNGKAATSHWSVTDEMQLRYPQVRLRSDKVITDQDGIYTGGGAFASLKLILYLIERFCGRETALAISKAYSIDTDSFSQAHFAVFTGQRQHNDDEILKIQAYIEQNYSSNISIDQVSTLTHTSRRNFIRRFKAATNNTPMEYLQRVRIEAAKKALESDDLQSIDLAGVAGYEDIKTFRMVFKKLTGMSPRDYRKKYARKTALL